MKKTKTILYIVLSLILSINSVFSVFADNSAFSWYCKRMKDNQRPPCPSEFQFIENHDCVWIDESRTDSSDEKIAYLTFDAGYENGNVAKILDVLKEKEVKGAFFILINLVENEGDLVKRMESEGHTVCNHTAHHKDMSKITDPAVFTEELNLLSDAYETLTGKPISPYYRPPEGRFSEQNLKITDDLGYTTVFWSFAYADWNNDAQMSPDKAKKKILENMHDGAVLLLHPTSATNAAILGDVIDEMRREGYRFGTLDELAQNNRNSRNS